MIDASVPAPRRCPAHAARAAFRSVAPSHVQAFQEAPGGPRRALAAQVAQAAARCAGPRHVGKLDAVAALQRDERQRAGQLRGQARLGRLAPAPSTPTCPAPPTAPGLPRRDTGARTVARGGRRRSSRCVGTRRRACRCGSPRTRPTSRWRANATGPPLDPTARGVRPASATPARARRRARTAARGQQAGSRSSMRSLGTRELARRLARRSTTRSGVTPSACASKPEDQAMPQGGQRHGLQVLAGDVEAVLEQRADLGAGDERLQPARAGAVAHVLAHARLARRSRWDAWPARSAPRTSPGAARPRLRGRRAACAARRRRQPLSAWLSVAASGRIVRCRICSRSAWRGNGTWTLNRKRSSCASGSG